MSEKRLIESEINYNREMYLRLRDSTLTDQEFEIVYILAHSILNIWEMNCSAVILPLLPMLLKCLYPLCVIFIPSLEKVLEIFKEKLCHILCPLAKE